MSKQIRSRARDVAAREAASEERIAPRNGSSAQPVDPKEPAADGSADQQGVTIDDAKLHLCLLMHLQGRTQKEIAKHFGVTDRTIRNWFEKLKDRKLAISKDLDPHNEVSRTLFRFAAREAELLEWKRDAEADCDRKAMQAFAKELRQLEKARFDFLRRLGLFTDLRFKVRPEEDSSAMQAHLLTGLLHELVPHPKGSSASEHDREEG